MDDPLEQPGVRQVVEALQQMAGELLGDVPLLSHEEAMRLSADQADRELKAELEALREQGEILEYSYESVLDPADDVLYASVRAILPSPLQMIEIRFSDFSPE